MKRQAGQGGNTAHSAPNVFSTFQTQCLVTAGLCSFSEEIQFRTKGNSNKAQNLTLTDANPLRYTRITFSYSQQIRCFWNKYNLPGRADPNQAVTQAYLIHTVQDGVFREIPFLCEHKHMYLKRTILMPTEVGHNTSMNSFIWNEPQFHSM